MAESFSAKVQAGHEKAAPTLRTSGSKGFKFDETEEYEQRAQRQRQLLVYGNSASRDKADVEEPPDDELKERSGPNESKLEPKLKEVKERREMTSIEKQCFSIFSKKYKNFQKSRKVSKFP